MKKKNLILFTVILSMAMLYGCGNKTSDENTTSTSQEVEDTTETEGVAETQEPTVTDESVETQESTEVSNDSDTDFASIMTEIYGVGTDATSVELVADNFKNFAFSNGGQSSSIIFESLANDWFNDMEVSEGRDIRSEFSECFDTVTSTAESMNDGLSFDVSYLNVVNGIRSAIGE